MRPAFRRAQPPLLAPRSLAPLALAVLALGVLLLSPSAALAAEDSRDLFTRLREDYGLVGGAVGAFAGGLLTCLTPCVYPMIAITVSVFGAKQASSRKQAVLLSLSFVMGIAVLFTTLLVGAALTGNLFGAALQKWWVNVGIAIVMGAMAASMFGAFELTLPEGLMQRLSSVGGVGYGGAFVLGLVSSLIAAPCTGPVLTGVILWIGKTQSVLLGALVGFCYALGLGLPFFLVGAFAVGLPKGGKWMVAVKSFFGTVLLVCALYFLRYAIPAMTKVARHDTMFMVAGAGAILFGILLGAVHLDWSDGGLGVKIRKALGITAATAGGFILWISIELPPEMPHVVATAEAAAGKQLLTWEHSEKEAMERAQREKRPLMVDFTADWCGACKEFTKHTFSDPRVMEKAGNFVAVKVDATNDEDPAVEQVKGKYKVVGLPTVVIYDSTGKERQRFTEFVPADKFLKALEGID
ncbi:protein-disulfide reductase DsbD family protein [Polyangium sorediatum]|uniref:Cytochrome c biogenesis protein CcdA n=1 Tax=Polyangium sorediatum TaxID=889274 RepID=A0ABT6NLX0_9BACT|nr:cytochrome c biogenesis protein CcdA [Polyangium sorediatum]MDI1429326.1 cytochrome c biogenesis protein CcdA [Polyangium sorediatum]